MSQANSLEILMLNLINAERAKVGADPLQFASTLNTSSETHSRWMLDQDVFSHTGAGGSNAMQRMEQAGYKFLGSWGAAENIAWQSVRGAAGLEDDVMALHQALMNSPGHKANILNPRYDEIGIGIEQGAYGSSNAIMITQNFALSSAPNDSGSTVNPPPPTTTSLSVSIAPVTTSVVEGNSGSKAINFTVSLSAASAQSLSVSYALATAGTNPASASDIASALSGTVTFAPGQTAKTITVLIAGDTAVEANEGFAVTLTGASPGVTIGTRSATATILNDDGIVGPGPTPVPTPTPGVLVTTKGTAGNDVLNGSSGDDSLLGLQGTDSLFGNNGNDILNGGTGNDQLSGGLGRDVFKFSDLSFGQDRITDYADGTDFLRFSTAIADSVADFSISGNGTNLVTLGVGGNTVIVAGSSPITLTSADFLFY